MDDNNMNSDDTVEKHEKEEQIVKEVKKYFDMEQIWNEFASPEDIITKSTLALKYEDKILLAHVFSDPVIEVTTKQVDWMVNTQGFVLQKTVEIKRSELQKRDIELLKKVQWLDPESLK